MASGEKYRIGWDSPYLHVQVFLKRGVPGSRRSTMTNLLLGGEIRGGGCWKLGELVLWVSVGGAKPRGVEIRWGPANWGGEKGKGFCSTERYKERAGGEI